MTPFRPTLAILLCASSFAVAETVVLTHQGYMLDGTDEVVDATVPMRFFLYDATVGGTLLWTGDAAGAECDVPVHRGYYAVNLGWSGIGGCGTNLTTSAFSDSGSRWLELEISGVRLQPRVMLSVLPRTALAASADDSARLGGVPAGAYALKADLPTLAALLPAQTVPGVLVTNGNSATWAPYGTGSGALVQLDGSGRLPALDGSQLSNLPVPTMAAGAIKGNATGLPAAPADLSGAQVTAMLAVFSGDSGSGGAKGLVPAPASGDAASGKFLKADGTWSVVATPTKYSNVFDITSGSGNWTVPPGVTEIIVEGIGGGGSGGRQCAVNAPNSNSGNEAWGGGPGSYARRRFTGLTPGSTIPYVVGSGGAAVTAGAGAGGNAGGTTTFGTELAARGGIGGGRRPYPGTFATGNITQNEVNSYFFNVLLLPHFSPASEGKGDILLSGASAVMGVVGADFVIGSFQYASGHRGLGTNTIKHMTLAGTQPGDGGSTSISATNGGAGQNGLIRIYF